MKSDPIFYFTIGFLSASILYMLISGEWLINDFEIVCSKSGKCLRIQQIEQKALIDYLRK